MSGWRIGLLVGGLVVALVGGVAAGTQLAGPSAEGVSPPDTASTTTDESTTNETSTATPASDGATSSSSAGGAECALPAGEPFIEGPSVELAEIGTSNGARVMGALYPLPDDSGDPWSQWGQGVALNEGRFVSALGDHIGPDGNSYIYEYDSGTGVLQMVGDILSYAEHQPGSWGYGKVHAQMVEGSCGEVYLASYWGTRTDLVFGGSYSGDYLFRLDPASRTITELGVPVDSHGIPSMAGFAPLHLVYGEAVDPFDRPDEDKEGRFFAYDYREERVVFEGPTIQRLGFRNILVDPQGRAYYSNGVGELDRFDPASNTVTHHTATLPGDWLRASTAPAPDGRVFGVTEDPSVFFVMDASGEIDALGPARGYTTSMALDPDGSRFFYIPDAHGGAWASGAPLISVDTATGEETVVAELNPLAEQALGIRLGGTYDIAVAPEGDTVYIGLNGGSLGSEDVFGEVALLVVELP